MRVRNFNLQFSIVIIFREIINDRKNKNDHTPC